MKLLLLLLSATVLAKPQRIVSTALTSDEILVSLLGISDRRIVALSNLAGNSLYSNIDQLPPTAKQVSNIEQLVVLRPDLIISTVFNQPALVNALSKLSGGQFVNLAKFATLDEVFANILTIGKAIDEPERAARLHGSLQERLRRLARDRDKARPRIINFFADNTLMGRNTLFEDIVNCAGGINVAGTIGLKGFQVVSTEVLATLTVDYLVVPTGIYQADKIVPLLKKRVAWRKLLPKLRGIVFVPARQLLATSHHVLTACEKIHAVIGN